MRRIILAMVCALLLVGSTASGALATTTRIPTHTSNPGWIVLNPGTTTVNGTVVSVRGLVVNEPATWNNIYADGEEINTINFDLDMVTGLGNIWGTGVHYPTAFPGSTWQCRFEMTFTPNPYYAGKGVCQGTGALHTWQWRVDLQNTAQGASASGYIFKPGD